MDSEFTPGKRGGLFDIPGGGTITVGNGVMTKKESIRMQIISPSDRHKYIIDMQLVHFYFYW